MLKHIKLDWQDIVKIILLIVFLISIFIGRIVFTSFDEWFHPVQNGVPNVFQYNKEYWSNVDAPVVAGNRIYLLYDYLGVVKTYDLKGNYLYTINFSNKDHHGISVLYAKNDELYFRENRGLPKLSYFKADKFVRNFAGEEAEEVLRVIKSDDYMSAKDKEGNVYCLSGTNIEKITPDGEKTIIIHRSFWLNLFQNNLIAFAVEVVGKLAIFAIIIIRIFFD